MTVWLEVGGKKRRVELPDGVVGGALECVVDGRVLEGVIAGLLADKRAAYLHAHFAKYGCYAARIERA